MPASGSTSGRWRTRGHRSTEWTPGCTAGSAWCSPDDGQVKMLELNGDAPTALIVYLIESSQDTKRSKPLNTRFRGFVVGVYSLVGRWARTARTTSLITELII